MALLGLSMGSAQAVTLNYADTYTAHADVDMFKFDNQSQGDVSIWLDTIQDGFNSHGSLFKLNDANLWQWTGIEFYDADATDYNEWGVSASGINEFGVSFKNGYDLAANEPGMTDTGRTVNLDAGSYLFMVTGFLNKSTAEFNFDPTGTLDQGFTDLNDFAGDPNSNWNTWDYNTGGIASPYKVYIDGAGVTEAVSAVPVPAAVWLFTSAIAGLGVVRRRKLGE